MIKHSWKCSKTDTLRYFGSIEHGGTGTFSNIMAPLTLFNEAPKHKDIAPLAL